MSIVRNTGYNVLGQVLPVLSALVTVPIYLRMVGPERFGVLSLAWLLLGYFGLFDLGLGKATAFRVASLRDASPQARADTFWAALTVNAGIGVVGGVVLWAAAGFFFGHVFKISPDIRREMIAGAPLLGASVPIATVTGVLVGGLQGRERFLSTNVVSVVSTVLFQLFPLLIAWRVGVALPLLLSGALAARALSLLPLMAMCREAVTGGQARRFVGREVKALLGYGAWVTAASIFGPVLVVLDRLVIGAVMSATAVTVYTLPYQFGQRIAILPAGLTTAMFPRLAAAAEADREASSDTAVRLLAALLSLPVLIAVVALGPFLRFWIGGGLSVQAAPVGRILFIGFWANAFALVSYVRLQASGRPDLVTKALLAEIPGYLVLLYLAMRHFGLEGCAFAWAVRCVADYILLTWMGGGSFKAAPLLAAHGLLLVLAVVCAGIWSALDWRLWLSESALAIMIAASAWAFLPPALRREVVARVGRWRPVPQWVESES